VNFPRPVYIRLTGSLSAPIVYEDDYEFEIGKAIWVRKGGKICIVSSGTTVGQSLAAATDLENENLEVSILNMHTIKPLDYQALDKMAQDFDHIFVVEEHSTIGGLGDAIVRYFNDHTNYGVKIHCHGIHDMFLPTGDYSFLLRNAKLDSAGILAFVRETLS